MVDSKDVENILIAIGENYRNEVHYVFVIMITMIINDVKCDSNKEHHQSILACDNLSAYEALRAIWVETTYLGRRGEVVTFRSMLGKIDRLGKDKIGGDRTKEIAVGVASIMKKSHQSEKMYTKLVTGGQVLRDRKTIKNSFVDRYKGLEHLGLVELHREERGPKKALNIHGVSLTPRGDDFMIAVIKHAILMSMDQHPDASEWENLGSEKHDDSIH